MWLFPIKYVCMYVCIFIDYDNAYYHSSSVPFFYRVPIPGFEACGQVACDLGLGGGCPGHSGFLHHLPLDSHAYILNMTDKEKWKTSDVNELLTFERVFIHFLC